MGIYLPKMEMPRKGQILVIFPDGTSYVCFNGMRENIAQTEAFPVPPHGRLGDLDELYKEALKRSETKDGYYNCLDPVISCYTIDHAPTIIPAQPSVAEVEIQSELLQNWHEEGER